MVERILIFLAIAIGTSLALWLIIRRSAGGSADRSPPSSSRRGGPKSATLGRRSGPDSTASAIASMMNWLIGIAGDVQGKTFHVGNRTATIGRGLGNFVQTTDADASRTHCQFMPVPGGLQIKDLDSSNGTYVNGNRVKLYLLKDGDEIRIGKAVFVFRGQGDFAVDHGLERKVAGARVSNQTQMGGVSDFASVLRSAMQSSGGDINRAAQAMGVKPDQFRGMLQEFGVDSSEGRDRGGG